VSACYQCPFCDHVGGQVEVTGRSAWEHYPNEFQVQCTRCGARGPRAKSESDAVKCWRNLTTTEPPGGDKESER
jgi:hypothetical protein